MYRTLLLCCQCALATAGYGQGHSTHVIGNYGGSWDDGGEHTEFTKDGNIIIAGLTKSWDHDITCNPLARKKAWLLKVDLSGHIIFSTCFGSDNPNSVAEVNPDDRFTAIAPTTDSGCIVADFSNTQNRPDLNAPFPYVCYDSVHGYKHQMLVKYDKNGNIQWTHCYGNDGSEGIKSISQTSDGGYIFISDELYGLGDVAYHNGTTLNTDGWLVKTDSVGNIQWQQVLGGTASEYSVKVIELSGKRYLTHIRSSSTDGSLSLVKKYTTYYDWFCVLDSSGATLQSKTIPWQSSTHGNDVIRTNGGGGNMGRTSR